MTRIVANVIVDIDDATELLLKSAEKLITCFKELEPFYGEFPGAGVLTEMVTKMRLIQPTIQAQANSARVHLQGDLS